MTMPKSTLGLGIAAVALSAGCVVPQPPRVPSETQLGAALEQPFYRVVLRQSLGKGEATAADRIQVVNERARRTLRGAQTVVFAPPETCADVSAADTATTGSTTLAKTRCGVLLSALESAAVSAGYEVVSWQVLKTAKISGKSGYLENARELGADVVFEISDWSMEERASHESASLTIEPYRRTLVTGRDGASLGDAKSRTVESSAGWERVSVPDTTAWRDRLVSCRALVPALAGADGGGGEVAGGAARLSLKAVDVASGKTLLFYSRLADVGEQSSAAREHVLHFAPRLRGGASFSLDVEDCDDYEAYLREKYGGPKLRSGNACAYRPKVRIEAGDPTRVESARSNTLLLGDFEGNPTPHEDLVIDAMKARDAGRIGLIFLWTPPGFLIASIGHGVADKRTREWNERVEATTMKAARGRYSNMSYDPMEDTLCAAERLYEPVAQVTAAGASSPIDGVEIKSESGQAQAAERRGTALVRISAEQFRSTLQEL